MVKGVSYKFDRETRMRTFTRPQLAKAYKNLRRKRCFAASNGCIVSFNTPRMTRPYVSVNTKPDKIVKATKVVGQYFGQFPKHPWYEYSHTCGIDRCINPGHIVCESASKNIKRDKCHRWGRIHKCQHKPRCRPFDTELAKWAAKEAKKRAKR